MGGVVEKIGDGGTPPRDDATNFNGGIPWVVIEDIKKHIYETKETLSIKGLKRSNAKIWKRGSIILSFGASIGEVGIAEVEVATKQGIAGIEIKEDLIYNEFLYFVLLTKKQELMRYANQTTIPEVRPEVIKEKIYIPLPPLLEQRKIAVILETIDNAIEKTDAIIEKYKRIKQRLMQDLFTMGIDENWQIRSEKIHKFKYSPLGRIPEEWEVVKLSDISNQIIDGTHFTPTYVEDGVPFLRVTDIQNKSIKLNNVMKISPDEHKFLIRRCKPEYGDILYSKNGTIGISRLIDWMWEFSIFVSICLIKPKYNKISNKFLKYFLDSEWVKKQIMFRSKQLSIINLHLEEIKEFLILLPPLPEQQRIAKVLSQIDEVIEKERAYREKLERIKKGLMEDLLTGKVRVNCLIEEADENVQQT